MDFIRRSRRKTERNPTIISLEQFYPHNVTLYRLPPTEDITVEEFEDLALERLKLLRIFELAGAKSLRLLSDEWKENITAEMNREGLKGYARMFHNTTSAKESDLQARRRDYISHFILKIAYCRSDELRRWFVAKEMEIFRYKFSSLSPSQIKEFLELNNINYIPLSEEEKNEVKDGLYESTMGQSAGKIELVDFYKFHFTEVLDLVRGRRCFVKDGYAYASSSDFIAIMAVKYQKELEESLTRACLCLHDAEQDERLVSVLKSLHTSYIGKDYSVHKGESIPSESLDQLATKSFPLCMRTCHEVLRGKHHLRHFARLQFSLFLKGIGVELEDALQFFRNEFTKLVDAEQFERKYAYNFRHSYGQVGSMINYAPFSCLKVIKQDVGAQDSHGCPFKILDSTNLKTKLSNYGLGAIHVEEVVGLASNGHYQLACGRYFEIAHDRKLEQGINHPNQYFELSQEKMGSREQRVNTPASKKVNRASESDLNKTLLEGYDIELWNIAEMQENEDSQCQAYDTSTTWDDDFDMTIQSMVD